MDRTVRGAALPRLTAAAAVIGVACSVSLGLARAGGQPRLGVVTIDDLHEGQVEIAAAMVLTLVAAVL